MSEQLPLWGIAFIVGLAYPLAHVLWIRLMQPIRLHFADKGIELLNSPDLSEGEKRIVDDYLDDAFDWKLSIRLTLKFIPLMVFRKRNKENLVRSDSYADFESLISKEDAQDFIRLHLFCVLGSNPFFGLAFVMQLVVLGIVVGSARKAIQVAERIVVGPTASHV